MGTSQRLGARRATIRRHSTTRQDLIRALQGCQGSAHQAKRRFMHRFTNNPGSSPSEAPWWPARVDGSRCEVASEVGVSSSAEARGPPATVRKIDWLTLMRRAFAIDVQALRELGRARVRSNDSHHSNRQRWKDCRSHLRREFLEQPNGSCDVTPVGMHQPQMEDGEVPCRHYLD